MQKVQFWYTFLHLRYTSIASRDAGLSQAGFIFCKNFLKRAEKVPLFSVFIYWRGNEKKVKKCEFFVNLTKIFGLYAEKQPSHPYLCFIYGDKKEKSLKCEVFVNIALFFVLNEENGSFSLIYSIERFFTGKETFPLCKKSRFRLYLYG